MPPKSLTYLEILEERRKQLLKHVDITANNINRNQEKLEELEKELQDNAKEVKQFKTFLKEYKK